MKLVLDIHEAGQILINYLFEHDKIERKETNICWNINFSNTSKSTVTVSQDSGV